MYGVFVFEVMCGRRFIEEGKRLLMDWVWGLLEKGEIVSGFDFRMVVMREGSDEVERVL